MIEEILYESHSKGKYREVMDRAHDIMGSEEFNERRIDLIHSLIGKLLTRNIKLRYYSMSLVREKITKTKKKKSTK